MFAGVGSAPGKAGNADAAREAVERLREMSADLRGCALLGPGGEVLAATGDRERWGEAASELWEAADAAADDPAEHVHVGTEEGEAFGVRHGGRAMVAVTDRFTLASLMVFDMRAILRDLDTGVAA